MSLLTSAAKCSGCDDECADHGGARLAKLTGPGPPGFCLSSLEVDASLFLTVVHAPIDPVALRVSQWHG